MTYIIDGTPYPDARTAVITYNTAMDNAEYPGMSEAIALLKYNYPDLTDHDITTLAEAVHDHATRPDQDTPTRSELRRMVKGQAVHTPPRCPAWGDPSDTLAALPPAYHQTTPPTSFIVRAARRLAGRA